MKTYSLIVKPAAAALSNALVRCHVCQKLCTNEDCNAFQWYASNKISDRFFEASKMSIRIVCNQCMIKFLP